MNGRRRWIGYAIVGSLLLGIGTVIVVRDAAGFRAATRSAFRTSCRRQAVTFEEFAEQWIVRDQLDSLRNAGRLLIMGDGLYVDAVAWGETLLAQRDEALRADPDALDVGETPSKETAVVDLPGGDVEVTVPLVLSGYPNSPIGRLRIGFSGTYANARIRGHLLQIAGIGLGAWIAVMATGAALIWWDGRSRGDGSADRQILRSGTIEIDTQACHATMDGVALDLTPKLYELLLLFARHEGEILSDRDILDAVWADSAYAASPDVKQHIYLLRRALGEVHPDPKRVIVNIKGFGYRLDPPTNEGGLKVD